MASQKKWSPIDFVIISGLLLLAATTINWFGELGIEPLDKWGAMMFETEGSQYTEGYESLGIDFDSASSTCKATMQGAADAKMILRTQLAKAEAVGDTDRANQINQSITDADNRVRAACQ